MPLELLDRTHPDQGGSAQEPDNFHELLPSELYINIFRQVIKMSTNPLADLCRIAKASNYFRHLIIHNPASILCRLDLTLRSLYDEDFRILYKLMKTECDNYNKVEDLTIHDYYQSPAAGSFIQLLLDSPWNQVKNFTVRGYDRDAVGHNITSPLVDSLLRFIMQAKSLEELIITGAMSLEKRNETIIEMYLAQGLGKRLQKLILTQKFGSHIVNRDHLNPENCPKLIHIELYGAEIRDIRQFDLIGPQIRYLCLQSCTYPRRYAIDNRPSPFENLIELSISLENQPLALNAYIYCYCAHGSKKLKKLDIKYCYIPIGKILNTPSEIIEEFHVCDIDSNSKNRYPELMKKWQRTLKSLCIFRIMDTKLIHEMLEELYLGERELIELGIFRPTLEAGTDNLKMVNTSLTARGFDYKDCEEQKECVLEQLELKYLSAADEALIFGPALYDSTLRCVIKFRDIDYEDHWRVGKSYKWDR